MTTVPAALPAAKVPKLNSLVEDTDRIRTTLADEFTLPLAENWARAGAPRTERPTPTKHARQCGECRAAKAAAGGVDMAIPRMRRAI
jgi:hypothetical protein